MSAPVPTVTVPDPINSLDFLPEKLRDFELYPKMQDLLNYVINGALDKFADVRFKYRGPEIVSGTVIQEIINELGFEYISSVMQTITNYQFNVLLDFLGLINLLKGSRQGLTLVLKLLGFDAIIQEWWEQNPQNTPMTFVITVLMNTSFIADPELTLNKIKVFIREYVFPTISNIDFKFSFIFAQKNVVFVGFSSAHYTGRIIAAI